MHFLRLKAENSSFLDPKIILDFFTNLDVQAKVIFSIEPSLLYNVYFNLECITSHLIHIYILKIYVHIYIYFKLCPGLHQISWWSKMYDTYVYGPTSKSKENLFVDNYKYFYNKKISTYKQT